MFHAGDLDVQAIDPDQIVRQPQGQGDERPEDEEVVEREAPDLQLHQRRELHGRGRGFRARATALDQRRVIPGQQEEGDGDHGQRSRPDLGHGFPAKGDHHERRGELGHRGPDVAGPEDAQGRALPFLREELRDVGDADRERAAGHAHAQRGQQKLRIGLGVRQQEGSEGRRQHDQQVDQAAAVLVGPDAEEHPHQRAGQDRRAGQQAELRLAQAQVPLDLHADDREDRPHRETGGEGDGARPQRRSGPSRALRTAPAHLRNHVSASAIIAH